MLKFFRVALRCIPILFLIHNFALSWGSTGHRLINLKTPIHLPETMADLKKDSLFYRSYASAPDYRKDYTDTSFFAEDKRHYIDIDVYPNFKTIPHNLDSMIALYGRSYVRETGTLPWAIVLTLDSLRSQFIRKDYIKAESTMSDLGHYIADATQPLHCTENYDGFLTGNNGIHNRYETGMITAYQSLLTISQDSARYIYFPLDYSFELILQSQALVDSVLIADTYAKNISGWSGSGTPPAEYYAALWDKTQRFTRERIQTATVAIAFLWYSAWLDAQAVTNVATEYKSQPKQFSLEQNYPNPFNPVTNCQFTIGNCQLTILKIYDALGREVETLVNEMLNPGTYNVKWDASNLPSGVYYYRIHAGKYSETKKLILMK
ncbi:MAG: T9SS type A sorting domain-containing protein [Ignavibacteriales bacterium]|nr:T9SS type A sorting domain-containing protein [Ignavibacteriales bacterium]